MCGLFDRWGDRRPPHTVNHSLDSTKMTTLRVLFSFISETVGTKNDQSSQSNIHRRKKGAEAPRAYYLLHTVLQSALCRPVVNKRSAHNNCGRGMIDLQYATSHLSPRHRQVTVRGGGLEGFPAVNKDCFL